MPKSIAVACDTQPGLDACCATLAVDAKTEPGVNAGMYLEHLSLTNLRCFAKAETSLLSPDGPDAGADPKRLDNVTLLLGDNGSGKTTVLRAVALAALAPVITSGSGYVPYSLVRRVSDRVAARGEVTGRLRVHEQDLANSPSHLIQSVTLIPTKGFVDRFDVGAGTPAANRVSSRTLHAVHEAMYEEDTPAFLIVGYGAARRVDGGRSQSAASRQVQHKERLLRYARVAGLFEEQLGLIPLSAWLPAWSSKNPGRHKQVVTLLDALLPEGRLVPKPRDGEYLFDLHGSQLPVGALSDGYRAYIAWVSDLLYHLCMGCPSGKKLTESRGVVLVDEIDLHLHPAWQRSVVPTLATTLPALQFIVTSHSPIVAGTLARANVRVLEKNPDDDGKSMRIVPLSEPLHGKSADQILTGGAFGLSSTRDPGFVVELEAVAQRSRDGDPDASLKLMRMVALGSAGGSEAGPPTPARAAKRSAARKGAPSPAKKATGKKASA